MMNPEKWTIKTRDVAQKAQRDAFNRQHVEVQPEHLLLQVISEKEGLPYQNQ